MPGYETLSVERQGHIATITLNRPERLNALNRRLTHELHEALDEVSDDFPNTRVVVLTGAGRGFCSGADVEMQAEQLGGDAEPPPYDPFDSITALGPHVRRTTQPVIAAVNGAATGAGLSLALASDIRIASEAARFAAIFVKRSLVPDTGASAALPDLVGLGIAAEMAYTGRIYDAAWALRHDLVNTVVPPERLLPEAYALAEEICNNPPLCVRAIKPLLHRRQSLQEALPHEHEANEPHRRSADRRESVVSFLEKRPPIYHGR